MPPAPVRESLHGADSLQPRAQHVSESVPEIVMNVLGVGHDGQHGNDHRIGASHRSHGEEPRGDQNAAKASSVQTAISGWSSRSRLRTHGETEV